MPFHCSPRVLAMSANFMPGLLALILGRAICTKHMYAPLGPLGLLGSTTSLPLPRPRFFLPSLPILPSLDFLPLGSPSALRLVALLGREGEETSARVARRAGAALARREKSPTLEIGNFEKREEVLRPRGSRGRRRRKGTGSNSRVVVTHPIFLPALDFRNFSTSSRMNCLRSDMGTPRSPSSCFWMFFTVVFSRSAVLRIWWRRLMTDASLVPAPLASTGAFLGAIVDSF
mmetsp:Transcript_10695/g.49116  ORF Transcript_10695/g.49116 Transcript_10695/m.49116 type:complete len:231 (+) Transcript_10695:593-1285(+)